MAKDFILLKQWAKGIIMCIYYVYIYIYCFFDFWNNVRIRIWHHFDSIQTWSKVGGTQEAHSAHKAVPWR